MYYIGPEAAETSTAYYPEQEQVPISVPVEQAPPVGM